MIPSDVHVAVTRNYGETAAEKSNELLFHMLIAVISVSLLIGSRWAFASRYRLHRHPGHARPDAGGFLSLRLSR